MEIKRLKEYTDDELKELLFFWFKYYMKKVFNFDELEKFNMMIDENPRAMFNMAIMLYNKRLGPTTVLEGIRGDMKTIEDILKEQKTIPKEVMNKATTNFIKEVVTSYNNPEPDVPLSESDMLSQILEMIGAKPDQVNILNVGKPSSINLKEIIAIVDDAAFKPDEIVYGMPNKNFVSAKALSKTFAFAAERIDKHKKEISKLVDKLPPFTRPRSFNELATTREGATWAFTQEHVEALLTLAIACGILELSYIKDGVPYYIRTNKKLTKIVGEEPSEFPCYKGFCQIKVGKELTFEEMIEYTIEHMNEESKKYLELIGYRLVLIKNKPYFYQISDSRNYPLNVTLDNEGMTFITDIDGKRIKYSVVGDCIRNRKDILLSEYVSFDTLGNNKEHEGEFFEIGLGNDKDNPEDIYSLQILYGNTSLDQKVYKYFVSKDQISATIESDLPKGQSESTIQRNMYFTDPILDKECPCALYLNESKVNTEYYTLSVDRTGEKTFDHTLISASNRDKTRNGSSKEELTSNESAKELAVEYLKTSRVKNLYNRVIEVLDNAIPGIKGLINENHEFSLYIEEIMKLSPDKIYEQLMNKCGIKEADVPGEDRKGPRKRRNV